MQVSLKPHNVNTRSFQGQAVDRLFKGIFQNQICIDDVNATDYNKLISNNPSLDFILSILPAVTWITDVLQMRYSFISSNVKRILGYTPQQFTEGDIKVIETLIHPEDILYAREQKQKAWDFYRNLPAGKQRHNPYTINYRLLKADGTYTQILEQSEILQTNQYQQITHLVGTYTCLANETKIDMPVALATSPDKRLPLAFKLPGKPFHPVLSKREIEIVKLIASGYSSKQIAQNLCISFHTVNTHRQKMIEKTHSKNTGGLIQFAAHKGLI